VADLRYIKRIALWMVISLVLQILVLVYFNFNYFSEDKIVKSVPYDQMDSESINTQLNVPADAKDFKVTSNAMYTAYLLNNSINIIDMATAKVIKTISTKSGELSYYRWVPERDIIIYSVSTNSSLAIHTFDVDGDLDKTYEHKIYNLPQSSKVSLMEVSPYTNSVYILIQTSDTKVRIYNFDIMENLSFINTFSLPLKMTELRYVDNLFYQNKTDSIYCWSGPKSYSYSSGLSGNYTLIGADGDDRIYLGKQNSAGKIVEIIYGAQTYKFSNAWKKINLVNALDPDSSFIGKEGQIYIKDKTAGIIYRLNSNGMKLSGSDTKYDGEFIELISKYIVSRVDNKIKLTGLK
jgi:hypothetical protein